MNDDEEHTTTAHVPVIDITPLVQGTSGRTSVVAAIDAACRTDGFFYVTGHGVSSECIERLARLSRKFFALDEAEKMRIAMAYGGRAWRGYFPVGGELTSGRPDMKEGLYFGAELSPEHPMVQAGTPMHGANLFPDLPGFRETVLEYMNALTGLGHTLMRGMALGLGLEESFFADRYTADPLILFRIFNYPAIPASAGGEESWGVGEHTDYGLLTILRQDDVGGLQVKSRGQWIGAPPVPDSFICNIGDMLDYLTRGLYRSTPHRVRTSRVVDRMSFPFFFDPGFNAPVRVIEGLPAATIDDRHERWDAANLHDFRGTYGDYILGKVAKVFPELRRDVL